MIVADSQALRSLIQEAGRQTDFYSRRGDDATSQVWQEIEHLAFEAKSTRRGLVIGIQEVNSPIPIKGSE